ncbi:hypothetical protein HY009_00310 [Candidatus Acetothermia bacterium]|nr:hypothetical protein [Candidatus Acetothermia bacterium]
MKNLLRIIAVLLTLASLQLGAGQMILAAAMGHDMMTMEQSGCSDGSCLTAVGCGLLSADSLFIAHPCSTWSISSRIVALTPLLIVPTKPPTLS